MAMMRYSKIHLEGTPHNNEYLDSSRQVKIAKRLR